MKPARRAAAAAALLLILVPLAPSPGSDASATGPSVAQWLAGVAFAGGDDDTPCPGAAAERRYDVVAIQIPIVYDHWGDFDPFGRLFVLAQDEAAVREQVAGTLRDAGYGTVARVVANPTQAPGQLGYQFPSNTAGAPNLDRIAVSPLVQPFVVRANLGECVTFELTNKLPEPVSVHVHAAPARAGDGSVLGRNDPDVTLPGETRSYTVYLPPLAGMEGGHFLHSHADPRFHTKHGLFGALVAEPIGTTWTAPDGTPSDTGQEAIIIDPSGSDFREYVVILHDEVELLDHRLRPPPIISRYGEYGPGTKAINLRTEPFLRRFEQHDLLGPQGSGELDRGADKSLGYSSYTYGDPALFMPRGYVGDPTKFRLLNAGDQHHVFHLHGGGDRWRNSPVSDDTQFDAGLVKDNPIVRSKSERIDVQSIGPGESYNAEIEGGAGGVQQTVGDLLFHCHVVEHYVAGMWGIWRVHNTLQPGLAELPDRSGRIKTAVNSLALIGTALPNGTVLDAATLDAWLRTILPAQGVPGPDDASVWDWTVEDTPSGPLVKGEPETTFVWPNYESDDPGARPDLLFDPVTKRPSYPMLQPHLGKRPPFAPGHGPAPYLGADPDGNHPDGLAPHGTRHVHYNVTALSVPVTYNAYGDVDEEGQVFTLAEDTPDVRSGAKAAQNLVLRANVGDKVDVILTSDLDEPVGAHSKVNMHIHLVQFDVQASDGVITGFNYEQSVRPAHATGTALAAPAGPGDTTISVEDGTVLPAGTLIGIGLTQANVELRTVTAVAGTTVTLDAPLHKSHSATERVGHEFVRYRWYADVELGTVYWHDHVDGLNSWRHGLFGTLIVEPRDSEWRHPATGSAVRSGPVADIIGPRGTFRELVLAFQDRSGEVDGRDLASFNLRSAPFDRRGTGNPLSSAGNGDPSTDILHAYPGDPVKIRLVYAANANTKAVGTFAFSGHRFAYEQHNPGSRLIDSASFGISAQHNFDVVCGAGGCDRLAGDYLYYMTQPELFSRGSWGIVRVHDTPDPDLLPLPGLGYGAPGAIPPGADRHYEVVALRTTHTFNERFDIAADVELFATASDAAAIQAGTKRAEPLVLRALPGEVIEITLRNHLDHPVSLSPALIASDPASGYNIPVGHNPDTTVAPGAHATFRWHADAAVGTSYLTSFGRPAQDALDGLFGALIVEPAGSTFHPTTGPSATVTLADATEVAEHVVFYASDDPIFQASVMPYTVDVQGIVSVNYRTEPWHERAGGWFGPLTTTGDPVSPMGVHTCQINNDSCNSGTVRDIRGEARNPLNAYLLSEPLYGAAETPVFSASAGQRVVLRSVGGAGDQLQVHHVAGHWWPRDPDMPGSQIVDSVTLGAREVSDAWFTAGPGGPGDYLYGSHRFAFLEAGAWGILRVD